MKGKKTPATALSVYAELSKAAGDVTPNAGEDKTAFLVRLTEAASALDDAAYNALSAGAQKWFNASGEAINADTPDKIPNLPGLPDFEEPPADDEGTGTEDNAAEQSAPQPQKETKVKGTKTAAKTTAVVKPTVKANPAAAPAKKAATTKTSTRGRTAANADDDVIKLLAKENPKRAGSASFKRFALYSKVKTVGAFLKAGGSRSDLRYDSEHKFISIG